MRLTVIYVDADLQNVYNGTAYSGDVYAVVPGLSGTCTGHEN